MNKPRLIIIDNDENLIALLRHRLELDGFNVLSALTATAGFKMILRSPPDLLIVEVNLPDIDGLAVVRELRTHEALQGMPVIILSSYNNLEYLGSALAAGVLEYWLKSRTTPAEISARVKDIVKDRITIRSV